MRRLLLNLVRTSFDQGEGSTRLRPTLLRLLTFLVATLILVWILKPDLFGLVPNSLDPMFYTGYAVNLDDALNAAGNRHYFVTRWTSYMPMYLFSEIFGPYWGRLALRLVMILVLSEMFWRVGYRLAFPTKSRLLGIFAVVTTPMFVRAFTTDYPEYFIIWGSMVLCLLIVLLPDNPNLFKSIAVGVLAIALLIANPFTSLLLGIALSFGIVFAKTSGISWRQLVLTSITATLSALVVLVLGYLLFKNHYAIGNVYQPTVDFVRGYTRPTQDGWTAPSKEVWLSHFSWLYLSPLLVLLSFALRTKSGGFINRTMVFFSSVGLMVYLMHIYVEIRRGNALETSYYWSMSIGPILIILYLISGQLSKALKARWSVLSVLLICTLIIWRIPQKLQFPSGTALFFVLAILTLIFVVSHRRQAKITPIVFLAISLWAQTGAPTYLQRSYGGDLNSPRYDLVYRSPQNESHLVLDETLWFLNQMDEIPDDWKSTFLTAGGWSASIIGTYIPHPFSRWLVPVSEENVFGPNVRDELDFGYRPLLVIYGNPEEVRTLKEKVQLELPNLDQLMDVTHSDGLGYRLVVLSSNESASREAIISMARLDRQIGIVENDGSVSVSGGVSQGFVSFGPYFGLGKGSYTATLEYTSSSREKLGYFEIFNDVTQKSVLSPLVSAGSGMQRVVINFEVSGLDSTWQLRTVYSGQSDVIFHRIVLRMSRES